MSVRERRYFCEYCGAQPGEPCRDTSGRATQEHVSRVQQATVDYMAEGGVTPAEEPPSPSGFSKWGDLPRVREIAEQRRLDKPVN